MRILAIDHGEARCGCAVSDPTATVVTPLEVIEPTDAGSAAALVAELGAEEVVVGLPVGLSGDEGAQARSARGFRDELAALVQVPVEMYDERMTTRLAAGSRRAGARAAEDSIAAAHLLESYLQARERTQARAAATDDGWPDPT